MLVVPMDAAVADKLELIFWLRQTDGVYQVRSSIMEIKLCGTDFRKSKLCLWLLCICLDGGLYPHNDLASETTYFAVPCYIT